MIFVRKQELGRADLIGSVWEHKKRGSRYVITGVCMIEPTWRPGFRYLEIDGEGFEIVRDQDEFLDGRFKRFDVDIDGRTTFD